MAIDRRTDDKDAGLGVLSTNVCEKTRHSDAGAHLIPQPCRLGSSSRRRWCRQRAWPTASLGDGLQIVTEHDLVERCRAGNREAQRELYDRTSEQIYRLLLKMTASPDDAFDLTQETYLKAYTRIGQFDGRSTVATWLYRIAVNEALQFLRRVSQTRAKLQEIVPKNGIEPDIEQSAVRFDMNDAIATLPPSDRAMLLLRYQEGLDYRAIAGVVGCAAGTVASRLNRARRRLREILRKSYAVGEETGLGEHPKDIRQVSDEPRTSARAETPGRLKPGARRREAR